MTVTDAVSGSLIRLPLWVGLRDRDVDFVIEQLTEVVAARA